MKNIINRLLKNKTAIIILLLVVGYGLFQYQVNRYRKLNNKYQTEVSLRDAMQDTMRTYINKHGEVVDEKLTLQGDLKRINQLYNNLSENQKRLIDRLNNSERSRQQLAAANLRMKFEIDSLSNIISIGVIDTISNTIKFKEETPDIKYEFIINNVKPFNLNKNVEHRINSLILPNEQFIEFTYDDKEKRDNYPISFSVINTNKYMQVYDIDSYIIPQINPDDLETNIFQRTWKWYQRQSTIFKLGIGGGIGFIIGKNL